MTFWPRLLIAVVCWFMSILVVIVLADYYLIPLTQQYTSILSRLIYVLVASTGILMVIASTLVFWFWVWMRNYWG